MDEVDFTILAATSVLGDLIEKCPPAEACRDAFDRMSKATVQMCMSTTGFSSSAQGLNSRRRSHSQHSQPKTNDDYFAPNNKPQQPSRPQRPKPTFDMGLNDLLGSPPNMHAQATPHQAPFARPEIQNSGTGKVKNEYEGYERAATANTPPGNLRNATGRPQPISSPSDYATSPPLSHLDPQIDPALLPSPPQPQAPHPPPQLYPSLPPQNTNPTGSTPNAFDSTYTFPDFVPGVGGMDFLQGNGWDDGLGGTGGAGGLGLGYGADLGVWDDAGGHDFSEGGNGGMPDLFEGFFFGGAGNF
jgi:hypothetical protein